MGQLMSTLNAFIAALKRLYENNYKIFNKEKDLRQLQIRGNLWRPAWFLHVTSLRINCFSHHHADLFSIHQRFIKRSPLVSFFSNTHKA
jgi:hypothetical protein